MPGGGEKKGCPCTTPLEIGAPASEVPRMDELFGVFLAIFRPSIAISASIRIRKTRLPR